MKLICTPLKFGSDQHLVLFGSVRWSKNQTKPNHVLYEMHLDFLTSQKGIKQLASLFYFIGVLPNYVYVCVYQCSEKIVIPMEKQKIIMQGNDASKVIIQYNDAGLSNSSGPFTLNAEYFVAINITFMVRLYIYIVTIDIICR